MTEFDPRFELAEIPTPEEQESPYYHLEDAMDPQTAENWPPYSMSPEAEEMLMGLTSKALTQELKAVESDLAGLAQRRQRILDSINAVDERLNERPLE